MKAKKHDDKKYSNVKPKTIKKSDNTTTLRMSPRRRAKKEQISNNDNDKEATKTIFGEVPVIVKDKIKRKSKAKTKDTFEVETTAETEEIIDNEGEVADEMEVEESVKSNEKVKTTQIVKSNSTFETNTDAEPNEFDYTDIVKVLTHVFPLKVNREDITIQNKCPVKDDRDDENSRELAFIATYKHVEVSCTCYIISGDIAYHLVQYYYAYKMSEKLIACRNMANHHAIFDCDILGLTDFIKHSSKMHIVSILKPLYMSGTLNQFLHETRKIADHLTHKYMLQMSITLFSSLTDAHAQNIGLVDISLNSFFVGDDFGLYFDHFQSCVPLNESDAAHNKPWMNNVKTFKCPEFVGENNFTHTASADVYLATLVLIELARNFRYTQKPYTIDRLSKKIHFKKEAVFHDHFVMIDIIEQGLKFNPEDRPTAAKMLESLEKARNKFLSLPGL